MKRLLATVLILIFLCGCGNTRATGVTPILKGITFDLHADYYNEYFECSGSIDENGTLCLTVQEPETIKGMKITVANGVFTAEYLGLTYTPKLNQMPFGSLAQSLSDVLSDITQRVPDVCFSDDVYFIESAENSVYYKLILAQSGLPISLEIPSSAITAQFFNTTIV